MSVGRLNALADFCGTVAFNHTSPRCLSHSKVNTLAPTIFSKFSTPLRQLDHFSVWKQLLFAVLLAGKKFDSQRFWVVLLRFYFLPLCDAACRKKGWCVPSSRKWLWIDLVWMRSCLSMRILISLNLRQILFPYQSKKGIFVSSFLDAFNSTDLVIASEMWPGLNVLYRWQKKQG